MKIEILDGDGNVINRIAASPEFAEAHYPGRWREAAPPPAVPEPPRTVLTRLAFRNRFTPPEKTALYSAAKEHVEIQIFIDDVMCAEEIDLSDPGTIAGVEALETSGLIAAGRAADILNKEDV